MTLFSLLLGRCGLSHREAADFLNVRLDTVKSWSAGRNPAPAGAIAELRNLYAKIEHAADKAVAECRRHKVDEVELGLASDDHEARGLGLPCRGAHAALLGITAARLTGVTVIIVPRGSTLASAAAADIHEREV